MRVQMAEGCDFPQEVAALFTEYTKMLVRREPDLQGYLDLQHYDAEVKHLEEKYGAPQGRLFLLLVEDVPAGCVGLRRMDALRCEMKRLYVRPAFQGQHLGESLVRQVIGAAREIGYRHMLLDTLPFLQTAIQLYRKYGFYEISRYNNNPIANSVYMRLDL